jgi:hypothetical protein
VLLVMLVLAQQIIGEYLLVLVALLQQKAAMVQALVVAELLR